MPARSTPAEDHPKGNKRPKGDNGNVKSPVIRPIGNLSVLLNLSTRRGQTHAVARAEHALKRDPPSRPWMFVLFLV